MAYVELARDDDTNGQLHTFRTGDADDRLTTHHGDESGVFLERAWFIPL